MIGSASFSIAITKHFITDILADTAFFVNANAYYAATVRKIKKTAVGGFSAVV